MKQQNTLLAYALASATLLLAAACQPASETTDTASTEADIAAIRALQSDWNAAVEAGSVAGYLAVLDDEIELLPTDAPPINGKDGYGAMLDGVFAADTFEIEVVDAGTIDVAGDIGYARYDYIIHRTPKAEGAATVSSLRKFIDIMRRQPDGSWRVYKYVWNYNEPGVIP